VGQPLEPHGEPGGAAIVRVGASAAPRAGDIAGAIYELTARRPNVDFALVALRRRLALPEGAAFGLFALGRSIGWVAQALEQRADGGLIRPRATYIGPAPKSA
jgi:citrate synthase